MAIVEDDEILQIFIEESKEHLDGIESDFLDIEEMGEDFDVELVNKVFRAIHSVKGGAGFLGLENIKELTHSMENLLNLIRNQELMPSSTLISALLEALDVLKNLINNYMESNDIDISEQLVSLKGATAASIPEDSKPTLEELIEIAHPSGRPVFKIPKFDLDQAAKGGRIIYLADFDILNDIERKDLTPIDIIKEIQQTGILIDSEVDINSIGLIEDLGEKIHIPYFVLFSTVLEEDIVPSLLKLDASKIFRYNETGKMVAIKSENTQPVQAAAASPVKEKKPVEKKKKEIPVKSADPLSDTKESFEVTDTKVPAAEPHMESLAPEPAAKTPSISTKATSLRVSVKLLDKLMNLAGELVLTRNQLTQNFANNEKSALEKTVQDVDLITSELQSAIMSTRMQPIDVVFNKFQRVVRDMAKSLNKQVELIIEGKDVELDKTIIEAIGDPLTHLVRNSIDHGIESPDLRLAAGKKLPATVRLSAQHEAGQVIIEVTDDGAGIDPAKVKAKALQTGLMDKANLDMLSSNELIRLIFRPGFSTAEVVTEVSGRGVGMDVVHSNLSSIGGAIDISSEVGKGTTIRIKLPLTLAIIPSLILELEGMSYAIPQINLVELVRIQPDQVKSRIERIDDAAVLRLRGELLPIIRLADALDLKRTFKINENEKTECRRGLIYDRRGKNINESDDSDIPQDERRREQEDRRKSFESAYNIIVVNAGDFNYGLIVDNLLDSEEIVVKPLGMHLREIKTYAGATILGDGKAALILDITGIANVLNLRAVESRARKQAILNQSVNLTDAQSLLIVHNALSEQFAIPLGLISRIEKIKKSDIETISGKMTIKYRGGSLVLCSIESVADVKPREDVDNPFVIIFPFAGKEVGVIISQIVDVINTEFKIDEESFKQPGILGSAIIMDHTTLLLDLYGIASAIMPAWVSEHKEVTSKKSSGQSTILLVEDSKFFLNQVKNFTEDAGYNVVTAMDGVEALDVINNPASDVNLVLTDIEMPNMDGLELTRQLRSKEKWNTLPIIALTSVAGEEAGAAARKAGIDEYLIKLDREKVLERIAHYLMHGRG